MSLPDLLSKYAEVIADWLVNECVDDIDADALRVLRYHGHAIPEDIRCSRDGVLTVWWESMQPKSPTECHLGPVVILHAKYETCWKAADVSGKTMTVHYTQNDADAARLAWIAECIARRLMDLVCATGVDGDDDPVGYQFLLLANKPTFLDSTPGGATGGAASVHWRIRTGVNVVDLS